MGFVSLQVYRCGEDRLIQGVKGSESLKGHFGALFGGNRCNDIVAELTAMARDFMSKTFNSRLEKYEEFQRRTGRWLLGYDGNRGYDRDPRNVAISADTKGNFYKGEDLFASGKDLKFWLDNADFHGERPPEINFQGKGGSAGINAAQDQDILGQIFDKVGISFD